MTRQNKHTLPGYCIAILGGVVILMSTGVVPVNDRDLNSPNAILFLCGLAFLAGGFAVAFPSNRRLKTSMVVIILVSFLIVGTWITVFGDARHFSGGFPFLSRESNAMLARIIFGLGGLMVLGVLLMALRELIRAFLAGKTTPPGGAGKASEPQVSAGSDGAKR